MKTFKLFLECRKSAKTGNAYHVLTIDVGYRRVNLTMDRTAICDILDIAPRDLYAMGVGEVREVAQVNFGDK